MQASPVGKELYEKCGFEERGALSLMGGGYMVCHMVRPAKMEEEEESSGEDGI